MLADQRHAQILDIVNGEGSATVVDLAARLGISESTVRRDLEKLDDSGCLSKVHGGAVALGGLAAHAHLVLYRLLALARAAVPGVYGHETHLFARLPRVRRVLRQARGHAVQDVPPVLVHGVVGVVYRL